MLQDSLLRLLCFECNEVCVCVHAECQIPDKANVFYAVNRSVPEVKFVIRKKAELDKIKQKKRKESAATKKKDFIL